MTRAWFVCALFVSTIALQAAPLNMLSQKEHADGWRLLFDGKTFNGWRNYGDKEPGPEWKIENGALVLERHLEPGESGQLHDGLMTDEEFGDFELSAEWKIAPGANSGILYRVSEGEHQPHETGIEFQILDNQRHPDSAKARDRQAGACYALYAPAKDVTHPVGEWNTARIIVRNNHVEHWLNGVKLLSYELGSADWNKRVKKSKFSTMPDFAKAAKGHILLQDHSHHVEFRNIKIHAFN